VARSAPRHGTWLIFSFPHNCHPLNCGSIEAFHSVPWPERITDFLTVFLTVNTFCFMDSRVSSLFVVDTAAVAFRMTSLEVGQMNTTW
jgi:hypothetical protein